MKKIYFYAALTAFLATGCVNDDRINTGEMVDFPEIDNTEAQGVGSILTTAPAIKPRLDSLKMYYYADIANSSPQLPGMSYKNEVKTSPLVPVLIELKHYFEYHSNGFLAKRVIELSEGLMGEKTKLIFDFSYDNDNDLELSTLSVQKGHEVIAVNSIRYNYNDQKVLESFIYASPNKTYEIKTLIPEPFKYNQYNLTQNQNTDFVTPKNVYSPEKNLLPEKIKLQYYNLFNKDDWSDMQNELGLFDISSLAFNHSYINTHMTFPVRDFFEVRTPVNIQNIQYRVRKDHYPEIIQYGNVNEGGYRYLFYYKK